jgi:hypothetical protein
LTPSWRFTPSRGNALALIQPQTRGFVNVVEWICQGDNAAEFTLLI